MFRADARIPLWQRPNILVGRKLDSQPAIARRPHARMRSPLASNGPRRSGQTVPRATSAKRAPLPRRVLQAPSPHSSAIVSRATTPARPHPIVGGPAVVFRLTLQATDQLEGRV